LLLTRRHFYIRASQLSRLPAPLAGSSLTFPLCATHPFAVLFFVRS
jgi:hypothetical protein